MLRRLKAKRSIVVFVLAHPEPIGPFGIPFFVSGDKATQRDFDNLIRLLALTISGRMEGPRHPQFNLQQSHQLLPEHRSEVRIAIRDNLFRKAEDGHDVLDVELRGFFGGCRGHARNKADGFGELFGSRQESVEFVIRSREAGDKVNGNGVERVIDQDGIERASFRLVGRLRRLTG